METKCLDQVPGFPEWGPELSLKHHIDAVRIGFPDPAQEPMGPGQVG